MMRRDDLGIGNAEPHLPRALIEPASATISLKYLPIEADRRSPLPA